MAKLGCNSWLITFFGVSESDYYNWAVISFNADAIEINHNIPWWAFWVKKSSIDYIITIEDIEYIVADSAFDYGNVVVSFVGSAGTYNVSNRMTNWLNLLEYLEGRLPGFDINAIDNARDNPRCFYECWNKSRGGGTQ